jgi:hypothetical protein
MTRTKILIAFLSGLGVIALYFSLHLGYESFQYFTLSKQSKAQISQWEIFPIKDHFAIKANYGFEAQEKIWNDSFTLNPPYYLNEQAALSSLKGMAKENWQAWYNPKNPTHSALERAFPLGLLIRTLICYGILIYFLYLYKVTIRV